MFIFIKPVIFLFLTLRSLWEDNVLFLTQERITGKKKRVTEPTTHSVTWNNETIITILALLEIVIKDVWGIPFASCFDFLREEIKLKYNLAGSYSYLTSS